MKTKTRKNLVISLLFLAVLACGLLFVTFQTKVEVNAATDVIYSADFEKFTSTATEDEIYGGTSIAGAKRSVVEPSGSYIENIYEFFDNGCQKSAMYLDTGRGISSLDTAKTYTVKMRFENIGYIKDMTLGLMVDNNNVAYNSVVIFNGDGTSAASNYGSEKFVTLVSAVRGADNWWNVEFTVKGTGSYLATPYFINSSDFAKANAEKNTGIRLSTFSVKEAETVVYELNVVGGKVGDEVFQTTGFAGGGTIKTVSANIFATKALKATYDFWPTKDGGWQKEALYVNENDMPKLLLQKQYEFSAELSLFGKIAQAHLIISAPNKGGVDSQIILKPVGTYEIAENGATKIFDTAEVSFANGVFKIHAIINGFDDNIKFLINMLSSDADGANLAKDTGVYLDNIIIKNYNNPLVGDYKAIYKMNFNNISADIEGGNNMFHATGFAGVDIGKIQTITPAVDASKGMKCVYNFYPLADGGWQKSNAYLDSGKTSGTVADDTYRFKMKIKPFGNVEKMSIVFNYPDETKEYVYLANGTVTIEKSASGSKLIKADAVYADGVYDLSVYVYGTGGHIFNAFLMASNNPDDSNTNNNTGFYLDDYFFEKKIKTEGLSFNVKKSLYNKAETFDYVNKIAMTEITTLKLNDTVLASGWSFENETLIINKAVMDTIDNGSYTLTAIKDDISVTANIEIVDKKLGVFYENDFSAMPNLNGNQEAQDLFYQNSWLDPAVQHNVFTEAKGDDKIIKFVGKEVSEVMNSIFQTNPNEGKVNMLSKDKLNKITTVWKPNGEKVIGVKVYTFDNKISTELFYIEIDLLANKRVDDAPQTSAQSWNVKALPDGWYELNVMFTYSGDTLSDKATAYVVFNGTKLTETSCWYLDNITVSSEIIPYLIKESGNYDLAVEVSPYYIVDLYKAFDITSVKIGATTLIKDTDYTLSETPLGYKRIDLALAKCKEYALNTDENLIITTSKGNEIIAKFKVINTAPTMPTEKIIADKAAKADVLVAVDFKDYKISKITKDGVDLLGMEYLYNETTKAFSFKYDYIKNLVVGEHKFIVTTTSGAQGEITLNVVDSTPTITGKIEFNKKVGGDLAITLNVFGKDITEVKLNNVVVETTKYTYANGKLTLKASLFDALIAGEYNLEIKTIATLTAKVTVLDASPEFSGEYTIKKGENLAITVNLFNKNIISIKIDGLALKTTEYSISGDKLTINAAIFDELSVGNKTLELVTEGGSSELHFTLNEKATSKPNSCKGSITGISSIMMLAFLSITMLVVKKSKKD